MLRLQGGQVESLWDEVLPEKLRELPDDLARIDALLRDEQLLSPIEAHWDREAEARGRSAKGHGRPTIPMQTYVRLMVLKHRYGWGYETLVREVSDSLHLRRGFRRRWVGPWRGCAIARGRWASACARSRARSGAGRARRRRKCSS